MSNVLAADEGDARWFCGCLFDWKAQSAATDGALSAVVTTIVRGAEPPEHVHSREDEAFFVLEGTITFKVGDEIRAVGSGGWVWAPRGLPHTFALQTDTAKTLILLLPGGCEEVFHEFGRRAEQRELPPEGEPLPDLDLMMARDGELGVTYVGPPLAEQLAARPAQARRAAQPPTEA